MKLFKIIMSILWFVLTLGGLLCVFILTERSIQGTVTLAVIGFLYIYLTSTLYDKIIKIFKRRWDYRYDSGFVKGAFYTMDVLHEEFPGIMNANYPIFDKNAKKIGTQSNYSAMRERLGKRIQQDATIKAQ